MCKLKQRIFRIYLNFVIKIKEIKENNSIIKTINILKHLKSIIKNRKEH